MRLLITGGTGYLGRFVVTEALAAGDHITLLSRRRPEGGTGWIPFDLATPPADLPTADALIHCAFDHLPGRYRGGEGDDRQGFLTRNHDGSVALFQAARAAGIGRVIFLSSRAVYGAYPRPTLLTEDLPPRPDTLYGQMKWQVEQAFVGMRTPGFCPVSLRATGVYGAPTLGGWHKWADLFADFTAGKSLAPRQGTEVHGADLAAALRLCLTAPASRVAARTFNVSDILLDQRELLAAYAARQGLRHPLPAAAPPPGPNVMDCTALRTLGWRPGGWAQLQRFLDSL
ncbi:NAD(P)-dependent oxidoreductase [Fluviibacterium sp. DFM31]|uniref:NAD(P)-dependent oxidoreductase n=1 Tax=Meridianimarinicoccus marinus TaxID=3231483 RepID=A0ABV3L1S6_9RHOB